MAIGQLSGQRRPRSGGAPPLAVDTSGRLGKHLEAVGLDWARTVLAGAIRAGGDLLQSVGHDELLLDQHLTQRFGCVACLHRLD